MFSFGFRKPVFNDVAIKYLVFSFQFSLPLFYVISLFVVFFAFHPDFWFQTLFKQEQEKNLLTEHVSISLRKKASCSNYKNHARFLEIVFVTANNSLWMDLFRFISLNWVNRKTTSSEWLDQASASFFPQKLWGWFL